MALRPVGARLILEGETSFVQGMNRAGSSVRTFEGSVGGASTKAVALGTVMGNLATGGLRLVASGITRVTQAGAGFLAGSVSKAAEFEAQMSGVAAVMGASGEELSQLKDLAADLGLDPNLKVSSTEAAAAIEVLAKNGLNVEQVLDGAARSTVALANATGADMAVAADVATDAMTQFGISANDMGLAIDGITGVVTNSKFGINDYRLAIANAGAIAAGSGLSFEDFNTVIAATASSFSSGADAGTSLKTTIQRLSNPTDAVASAMEQLGISLFDNSGNMVSMAEFAGQLNTALAGMTEEQKAATVAQLGGADASRTLLALSTFTAASFTALGASVNAAGQAQTAAAERVDNLAGSMDILDGVIEGIQLAIGDQFLPVLTTLASAFASFAEQSAPKVIAAFGLISGFVTVLVNSLLNGQGALASFGEALAAIGVDQGIIDTITGIASSIGTVVSAIISFVDEHSAAFTGAITAIGAVLAGAAIAATISGITAALTALVAPIPLLIAGVGLLGAAWSENWFGIRDVTAQAIDTITPIATEGIATITAFWMEHGQTILSSTMEVWTLISSFFGGILLSIGSLFQAFRTLFTSGWTAFGQALLDVWIENWTNIVGFLGGLWGLISPFFDELFTSITDWFGSQDWLSLATVAVTAIVEGVGGLWDLASPLFDELFANITDWFGSQDWASMTTDAVTTLADGFKEIDAKVTTHLTTFFDNATTWFQDQDWESIGKDAGVLLANGLKSLFDFVLITLPGFFENVKTWFTSVDWGATTVTTGEDLIQGLIDGIANMGLAMLTAIADFASGVVDGFRAAWGASSPSTIFFDIGLDLIQGLIDGVNDMLEDIKTALTDIAQSGIDTVAGFAEDFKGIGGDLMEGLKEGILNKVTDIASAAKDAVNSILDSAKGALGIGSPSKEFIDIGLAIGQGLVIGIKRSIDDVDDAIKGMLDATGPLTAFGGVFSRQIVDPLAGDVERLEGVQKDFQKAAADLLFGGDEARATGSISELALSVVTGRLGGETLTEEQLTAARHLVSVNNELSAARQRLREQEEKLLAVQKQQQDLAFLKQQLDLIKLIKDEKLDTGILAGITLGLDANISDVLAATTAATQAIIDQASADLQIASPSKVFQRMGEQIIQGLATGIAGGGNAPVSIPATAAQIMTQGANIVNNTREIVVNYTNNSGAPLSDQSELDFLLANYT